MQLYICRYVDEMTKRKGGFKKPFEITTEKIRFLETRNQVIAKLQAHILPSHAFKWACLELMFAIVFAPQGA